MFQALCPETDTTNLRKLSIHGTLDSSRPIFQSKEKLDGTFTKVFTTDFIHLLDTCIVSNNLYVLSKEQEIFFKRYLEEADAKNLSDDMQQFDIYLGSYLGE